MISGHLSTRLSFSDLGGKIRISCKDAPGIVFDAVSVEVFSPEGERHRLSGDYHQISEEASGEFLALGKISFLGVISFTGGRLDFTTRRRLKYRSRNG
jgi:hypothetical protein